MSLRLRIALVRWVDSATSKRDVWRDVREAAKFSGECIENVGFLVRNDKKWVVLVGGHSEGEDVCCVFAIPKGCVVSIRYLSAGRRGK